MSESLDRPQEIVRVHGQGKGGSITDMKWHPYEDQFVYTTSIDGTVRMQDFTGKHTSIFLNSMDHNKLSKMKSVFFLI